MNTITITNKKKTKQLEYPFKQKFQFDGSWHRFSSNCLWTTKDIRLKDKTRSEHDALLMEVGWLVNGAMRGRRGQNVCRFACTVDVNMAENVQSCCDKETYASNINVFSQSRKD